MDSIYSVTDFLEYATLKGAEFSCDDAEITQTLEECESVIFDWVDYGGCCFCEGNQDVILDAIYNMSLSYLIYNLNSETDKKAYQMRVYKKLVNMGYIYG